MACECCSRIILISILVMYSQKLSFQHIVICVWDPNRKGWLKVKWKSRVLEGGNGDLYKHELTSHYKSSPTTPKLMPLHLKIKTSEIWDHKLVLKKWWSYNPWQLSWYHMIVFRPFSSRSPTSQNQKKQLHLTISMHITYGIHFVICKMWEF